MADTAGMEARALGTRYRTALLIGPDKDEDVMATPSGTGDVLRGGTPDNACAGSSRSAEIHQLSRTGAAMDGALTAFVLAQPASDSLNIQAEGGGQARLSTQLIAITISRGNLVARRRRSQPSH